MNLNNVVDSNIKTKIGLLPESWKVQELRDVFPKIVVGYVGNISEHYCKKGDGIPFIRTMNVRDGYFDQSEMVYVTKEFHNANKKSQLQNDDILIARVGANMGMTCKVEKLTSEANAANVIIIKKSSLSNSDYYSYVISSDVGQKQIYAQSGGGAQAVFNTQQAQKMLVPVPPLSEQRKIAEILSTWDNVIEKSKYLIDLLQQHKNGLMQRLLTGQSRFPGFDGEWKEYKLEQVASKNRYSFTGGPFGSNLKAESYTPKGVRIIQLQNIGDGEFLDDYKIYTSEEKADELISCNIYPGDIILSKMGDPVARATVIPNAEKRYLMASDGIRLEVDKDRFDTQFIIETINAFEFRKNAIRHSVGSTRQRISLGDLRNLPIKAPLIDEQQRISSVLQACNQEIELHQIKLKLVQQQKKGLMQKLLTGQIRVKV
jgi:type I restriction enzyme S subunit